MGYSIPQDFSVVGFDNDIYATLANPQLTTVEVDVQEMARTAVKSIMDKVANPNRRNGRVLVQGNIIYRDSVRKID
ncbi:putative HTH-type transcriptional repressor ExuR [compost metagenome]